ncbi:unnamed protein product [Musa textilis]
MSPAAAGRALPPPLHRFAAAGRTVSSLVCLDLTMTNYENSKLEERLQHLLVQFQVEAGVLDRMVYKNKNQHRRSSYFQYLLKVRRDVKLLQSAGLKEILKVLFPIINGTKAAQKAFYPARSKSKSPGSKHNCQNRLLGVARLLSQGCSWLCKTRLSHVARSCRVRHGSKVHRRVGDYNDLRRHRGT